MKKGCLAIVMLLLCGVGFAQRSVNVSGEYRYVVPENVAIDKARVIAIERAQNEALATAFGTIVSQTNTAIISNEGGESQTTFRSYGGTETKGEWLGNTHDPEVSISYEGNTLVVLAKVWGKARELKSSDIELMVKTLCNDIESEHFVDNDRFAVRFKTPTKGYFAIFLVDDNVGTAYCLLPYETDNGKAREVKSNVEYEFLSTKDVSFPYQENTVLTTSRDIEINRLVFIFSTNEFMMPLTNMGEYVMELKADKFFDWLRKCRIKDEDMQTIERTVDIRSNKE